MKYFVILNTNFLFKENSIDLIVTIHSLEPNNKIKEKFLKNYIEFLDMELFLWNLIMKLLQKKKKRMLNLGYVKGFERLLKNKKINYQIVKKKYHINNENISSLL